MTDAATGGIGQAQGSIGLSHPEREAVATDPTMEQGLEARFQAPGARERGGRAVGNHEHDAGRKGEGARHAVKERSAMIAP